MEISATGKKKARGDGYTTVNARAELYIVDEQGNRKLIAANIRDTDEKIKEIIQLDANQFKQILMIPQGDFRKLLTSDSKEKEVILQRLFRTELYKQIEEQLKEKASLLKREVESGINERSRQLKGIAYHGNTSLEAELAEEVVNDNLVLSLLEEVQRMLKADVDQSSEKMAQQKLMRDEAKRKADVAEDIIRQMSIRDQLVKKQESLQARKEEVRNMQISVELAYKAANLKHQEQLCQRLKRELDSYNARLLVEMEQLDSEKLKLDHAKMRLQQEEQRQEIRDNLTSELTKLLNMREDVYSFSKRQAELEKIEAEIISCRRKFATENEALSKWKIRLEEEKDFLKVCEQNQLVAFKTESKISNIKSMMTHLQAVSEAVSRNSYLQNKFQIETKVFEKVKSVAGDARLTLEKIEEGWMKAQAGHLGKQLQNGEACPVCGSDHHPNPARISETDRTEEDVKAAKMALTNSEQEMFEAERSWLKLKAEVEFHQENTAKLISEAEKSIPDFDRENIDLLLEDYEHQLKDATNILDEAKSLMQRIPETNARILKYEQEINGQNEKLNEMLDTEKRLSIQFAEADTIVKTLSKSIPENMRQKKQFDAEVARLDKEVQLLNAALETARKDCTSHSEKLARLNGTVSNLEMNIKEKEKALDTERKVFLKQLEKEEFETYKEYHSAKMKTEEIKSLEDSIQAYREEYRSNYDMLQDYEKRLENKEKPDLQLLETTLKEAEDALITLGDHHAELVSQIKRNKEIEKNVKKINEEIKALEVEYDLIGELSDITRGQNTYRLTFERFVLASFLDGILEAANSRLTKMTSGRYQLLRKTDRSKGNVQSGLELLIFDQYTGQNRHVKTLSGGESFKAALSLALGLADVVQQHAGGVSLETMFIDEGFGTLDPESLDHAIEALMDIQSSGRLVGIISHVPELKERIDARLEVTASQTGSKAKFHFIG